MILTLVLLILLILSWIALYRLYLIVKRNDKILSDFTQNFDTLDGTPQIVRLTLDGESLAIDDGKIVIGGIDNIYEIWLKSGKHGNVMIRHEGTDKCICANPSISICNCSLSSWEMVGDHLIKGSVHLVMLPL